MITTFNWNGWYFQDYCEIQKFEIMNTPAHFLGWFFYFGWTFLSITQYLWGIILNSLPFCWGKKKGTTQTVDIILSDSVFCLSNNPPICNSGMVWIISFHFLHSRLQNSHSVYWTQKIQAGDCFYRELHFEMLCLPTGNFWFP